MSFLTALQITFLGGFVIYGLLWVLNGKKVMDSLEKCIEEKEGKEKKNKN